MGGKWAESARKTRIKKKLNGKIQTLKHTAWQLKKNTEKGRRNNNNNNNNNANICIARLKQNSSDALMAQTKYCFSLWKGREDIENKILAKYGVGNC